MVAVAIGGAALIGAGATIIGGNAASHAQQKSDQAAINEQQSEYNQTRSDYAPWRSAGSDALTALKQAYGLAPSAQPYGGFTTSPGYQFRVDQGVQAIDRGAAARGALTSGGTVKEEQRYGDNLAGSEFNNYTSNLENIAGLGANATSGTAAAGSSAANNISNSMIASGNARASSYANMASGVNTGINNALSAYLMRGQFGGAGGGGGFG
jgi:hypothetical protein